MIDLHIHTTYSDGTDSVTEVLKKAEELKLEIISITDHDSVEVYNYLEENDYSDIYKGEIITGGEFNTVYDGVKIELLGYGFDYKKLDKWIREYYKNGNIDLNKEYEILLEACKKNNIKIGQIIYNKEKGWPIDFIFSEIKRYEENKEMFNDKEWNDIDIFFSACVSDKEFPLYMDFSKYYPTARELSEAIRDSGGKVFIAHVFRYPLKNHIAFIDSMIKENIIDGIEVYYSGFNNEQTKVLEEYCKRNKILMSGRK